MRVALTGGGTGGHIYPALAIGAALRDECARRGGEYVACFFGNRRGLESSIVPATGLELEHVPSRPLQRRVSLESAMTLGENALGVAVATRLLAAFAPDIVIATGGYVCFPVVVAARGLRAVRKLRAPVVLLEENARPGLTNRLVAPLVDEVWGAFDATAAAFGRKFVRTGIPVRANILDRPSREDARLGMGIPEGAMVLLVMGGSQGARSINRAIGALVTRRSLPAHWWIVHVCGERDYAETRLEQRDLAAGNRVTLVPYLADPGPAYAAADLVVARAGASTLAELAATGTPSLLIPYPYASENHQMENARAFVAAGAARILEDGSLSGDALWWSLLEATESAQLARLRAAAAALAPGDTAGAVVERVRSLLSPV